MLPAQCTGTIQGTGTVTRVTIRREFQSCQEIFYFAGTVEGSGTIQPALLGDPHCVSGKLTLYGQVAQNTHFIPNGHGIPFSAQ